MLLNAVLLAVVLGALSGALWAVIDNLGYKLTRNMIEETQIVSIIRMVLAGIVAQNVAAWAVITIFHAMPVGGLASLISIVLSILIYMNVRQRFDRGF
jgi:hypothetical protein